MPRVALLTFLSLLLAAPAQAAFPGDNGRIAFESHRDETYQVYSMQPDGSDQRNLSANTHNDFAPRWSPDGKDIAFHTDRDGNNEIYLMNEDGSVPRNLTDHPASDVAPSYSPDGEKIAFTSTRGGQGQQLFVMDDSGNNVVQLTHEGNLNFEPAWSPDGSKIAFLTDRDGNWEIYVMNADGSGAHNITQTPQDEGHPDWSPNGLRLTYWSSRDGDPDIWVSDADGSDAENLTDDEDTFHTADYRPSFSPDGDYIAWNRPTPFGDGPPRWNVWTMRSDGSLQNNLTSGNGSWNINGGWQPLTQQTTECEVGGAGGWALRGRASEDDGLVLENVRLGPRQMARMISLPYFELDIEGQGRIKGELTLGANDVEDGVRSSLFRFTCEASDHEIVVEAIYNLYDLPGMFQSRVIQRYEFHRRHEGEECEPTGKLPCARFWPTVKFELAPGAEVVESFRSIQRFEMWPDRTPGGTANLFHDRSRLGSVLNQEGVRGLGNPVMKREDSGDDAIEDGEKGYWDNYHQTARDTIGKPGFDSPGCAECVHMHWHWGEAVNYFSSGFTDDLPLIREGSPQSARWAVTRREPVGGAGSSIETDPVEDGYESLVNNAGLLEEDETDRIVSRPVFWFDAESEGVPDGNGGRTDEFFPQLHDETEHGGEGSAFFAPAEHLPKLPDESEKAVGVTPLWSQLRYVDEPADGLPTGWALPVEISTAPDCRTYDSGVAGCRISGGDLHGPLYLMGRADANWLNPDDLYGFNRAGDAFATVLGDDGRPLEELGYDVTGGRRLVPQTARVTMVFDEIPHDVDLELVRAPHGGNYDVWEGFGSGSGD